MFITFLSALSQAREKMTLYFNLVQSKLYINVLNLSTAGMFLYALVDSVLN